MTIPEIAASDFFPVTVWTPGGAAIIFAQSWNFELKFFIDIDFMQKIGCENSFFDQKSVQNCQKLKFENFMDTQKKG